MSSLFGAKGSNTDTAPPPPPTVDTAQPVMEAAAAAARDRATRGRASTIISGGSGVDSTNTKYKSNVLLGGA